MRTIFQLISSIQLGGAENVAFELAEHCGDKLVGKPNITVVELYGSHDSFSIIKKNELIEKGINIITLHRGSKRMSLILAPFNLARLIIILKPLIIHSHTDLPDYVLAMALRILRLLRLSEPQIIRTIHNTQLWRNRKLSGRVTETAYENEPIVSVSSYAMNAYENLRKNYNLNISNRRHIIFNGRVVPIQLPHSFKLQDEKINIAFCGRFESYKGIDKLIVAIPEIEKQFPDKFQFHLIGDGSYKKQLQRLENDNHNVCLYDPIPNVSAMFYAFDYLWMPSHFEGLALISIESSFSGTPVIASFAPGLDETLPVNWPLKFHLDNDKELYDIFRDIINAEYNREELQKIAFDYVNKNFSHSKMINSYNELYNNMI